MIIRWSVEDNAFIVDLPEFPGCRTHGDSYVEAARHGKEVLELLVSTEAEANLPVPSFFQAE